MITRDTILGLAEQAGDEDNLVLRYLLLTIGGMLGPDGNVVDLPDGQTPWGVVSGADGAMGRGLMLATKRQPGYRAAAEQAVTS